MPAQQQCDPYGESCQQHAWPPVAFRKKGNSLTVSGPDVPAALESVPQAVSCERAKRRTVSDRCIEHPLGTKRRYDVTPQETLRAIPTNAEM
ncbi:hypothetical protein HPB47_021519 [Ixodes persulcatus]|uniref:Uncharacterized protein n=1 Tax=Ixodes persulcatus TaxID=34615 RepID=A0AC60QCC6_IXOPE|nr:hypothetical protein HPB47_021519 [Ixodes persulcatus]